LATGGYVPPAGSRHRFLSFNLPLPPGHHRGGGYLHGGIGDTGFAGASAKTLVPQGVWDDAIGFRVLWDDRPGATAPVDDLRYAEIDKRIIALMASARMTPVATLPEFKVLVGQRERAARRLALALRTQWIIGDEKTAEALESVLSAIGPEAVPVLDRAAERCGRYASDAQRASGFAFGLEYEALKDRAWYVVPVDSQPLSRPLARDAERWRRLAARFEKLTGQLRSRTPGSGAK
jgi:hypothetical protein